MLLVAGLGLAGCTFTPVYGDYGVTQQRLEVAYSKPGSRLDQIIIQDLSLKLGKSDDPNAPLITISSDAASRTLTRTGTTKPATQQEVTVNVSYTVAASGRVVTFGSRSASAVWTTRGQVFADEAAYRDAEERAARAASETVRLSILAALATPARPAAAASGQ
ncbi:MAG: hypothetical protein ACYCZU_03960 [Devosia sp.]